MQLILRVSFTVLSYVENRIKNRFNYLFYLFIVLFFASQLPALDEKKETLQNASVEICVTYIVLI